MESAQVVIKNGAARSTMVDGATNNARKSSGTLSASSNATLSINQFESKGTNWFWIFAFFECMMFLFVNLPDCICTFPYISV